MLKSEGTAIHSGVNRCVSLDRANEHPALAEACGGMKM